MNKNFKVGLFVDEYGRTYMSLEFTNDENYRIKIPRICLSDLAIENSRESIILNNHEVLNTASNIVFKIIEDSYDGIVYIVQDLNVKKPKELTIKEIEKKFGYPIRIKGE